jgi:6-pyruvoyltetrahydropterin/6-carboxytetrahydropterin synthase
MVFLRRTYRFCAAHRYHNPELSDEENRRVFGKCNYQHGHGHNYQLEVILGPAEPDARTGMIFDLGELDAIVADEIVEPLDHHHLNHDVPYFRSVVPTTEEIARFAFARLDARLPAELLDGVVVREDDSLAAECYRRPR